MAQSEARAEPWIDRALALIAPRWHLTRARARLATLALRHYEGATSGRRTQTWYRANTDANAALWPALAYLRGAARDLVRNNPHAESALSTIADHVVGWGIVARTEPANPRAAAIWKAWAETTDCDADGRNDFYGIQALVMRTVAEAGECLVRRRIRRLDDGFALPLHLQVLEPDFLDTSRVLAPDQFGNRTMQGVEFDALGRRTFYWIWPQHPGSPFMAMAGTSYKVPASEILHIFRSTRAGQVRAASWFAPVLVRSKDFDEFEDATLMKQKIAACLAVIMSDMDGTSPSLGTADDTAKPPVDSLEPGMILNVPPGRTMTVVPPPTSTDYGPYAKVSLRAIATGLGVTYEDLTGDYENLPFSAARMSRLRHYARVHGWRWRMLIPHLCTPVWNWAMQAAALAGQIDASGPLPGVRWSPPPMPMVEPDKEGLASMRNVRACITTLSEEIRERGFDPDELFAEMAADNKKLDDLGLVVDSDPRRMTQAGQAQGSTGASAAEASGGQP